MQRARWPQQTQLFICSATDYHSRPSRPPLSRGPGTPPTAASGRFLHQGYTDNTSRGGSASTGVCSHTIQTKDTFDGLEHSNTWPEETLKRLNPGVNYTDLQIGQEIAVPCAPGAAAAAAAAAAATSTPTSLPSAAPPAAGGAAAGAVGAPDAAVQQVRQQPVPVVQELGP